MRCNNFNGLLKEICLQYPDMDLPGYLADNLQLPLDKAELLATRIEKQLLQKTAEDKKQNVLSAFEHSIEADDAPAALSYTPDCLTSKEFEYFIKWLLYELGYEAQPELYAATEWGIDVVATKDGEKVAVQAVKCPKTHSVNDTIIRLTEEIRGDCPKALVISTANFTDQAKTAAERAGIELWDNVVLNRKIAEAKQHGNVDVQTNFPSYQGSLLQSLLALAETKTFQIELKSEGKYDVRLPGVKYPLLTFQAQNGVVVRCVERIKYNEPVSEAEGAVIVGLDEANQLIGPKDEQAYGLVTQYLEQFLE